MFQHFETVTDRKAKSMFVEKIRFISQMMVAAAKLNKFDLNSIEANDQFASIELSDFGIITSKNELPELKKFIKKEYVDVVHHLSVYHLMKEKWGYPLQNFSKSFRANSVAKEEQEDKFTYADFFAGAGGLSLGFSQAGYRVELVNEIEPLAVETYKYNHPEVRNRKVVTADIKTIVHDIESFIGDKQVDVVIGGPPCQSFSSANQQRIIDDPRNELYKYFIQAVEKIKPKFVVMENVVGMKKVANQVVEDYRALQIEVDGTLCSYNVDYHVFNSEDFSVAQRRQRLIFIAVRTDIQAIKNVTPQQIIDEIISECMGKPKYILADALQHLRPLDANTIKGNNEVDDEKTGCKVDVDEICQSNEYLDLINPSKSPYVFNHKARFLNETNYEVYRLLDQGDDATNPKVAHVMPYRHRNHVFKDKYFKLIADRASRTITAHLTMDGHSHIHPTQIRSLTPREAARIQSFPDDFVFLGPYLKTFTQIGNAVPPMMAKTFGEVIKRYLK